jgi:hypothetical protein
MKPPKKKKTADEIDADEDTRPVRFEALEELTHGDVVEQLKNGISRFEPLEFEDELRDEAA